MRGHQSGRNKASGLSPGPYCSAFAHLPRLLSALPRSLSSIDGTVSRSHRFDDCETDAHCAEVGRHVRAIGPALSCAGVHTGADGLVGPGRAIATITASIERASLYGLVAIVISTRLREPRKRPRDLRHPRRLRRRDFRIGSISDYPPVPGDSPKSACKRTFPGRASCISVVPEAVTSNGVVRTSSRPLMASFLPGCFLARLRRLPAPLTPYQLHQRQ